MMAIVPCTLNSIIEEQNLSVYFQPIVANRYANIFAYEALIRGPLNTPFHSPLALFDEAAKQGRLVELELLCRELSIVQFQKLNLSGKLFLNASPDTLFQPDFRAGETLKMLDRAKLPANRVVIEVTEHSPLENYEVVREAIKHYKSMGFEIAMDDLGSGYSGLRMWDELRPDYVKIDRYFMVDIGCDKVKQQFVRSIKHIAEQLDCKVIAEGVETEDEFRFLNEIEVQYCQGFYFAKPSPLPLRQISKKLFFPKKHHNSDEYDVNSPSIAQLLHYIPPISEHVTVEFCANLFKKNPDWESIPIVEQGVGKELQPLGLIRRSCLTNLLFLKYGRELSGQNSISPLVDRNVMILESGLAIEQVSNAISQQLQAQKAMEFIITKQGEYKGVGSIISLIKMISNQQINNAQYANPLTLLPGNVPINKKLEQFISAEYPFVIAYIDLDNFKPYNDYYGYEKGDQIITGLANILRNVVTEPLDFIGHIGGDDFIVITTSEQWVMICENILSEFSEWVRHRYFPEDQVMGGISANDRFGQKQFYPMLSLSIGCVSLTKPFGLSHHDVAVLASDAKSLAKKKKGNSLYISNEQLNVDNLIHNQQLNANGYSLSA